MVQADLDDYDSLVRAFDGADGAFCMTNFFETFSAEQETQQAANQARAAAAAGVRHAIWSTAEDTRRWYPLDDHRMPTLPGGYKVPNWDGKGEGDQFFAASGVPTTYLLTPFHWEAFVFGLGAPQPGPDGVRTLAMPLGEARLPGIAAEDIGRCAYAIFQDPARFVGETVGIAGEHLTGEQLAAGLSEVFGETGALPARAGRGLPRAPVPRRRPRREHVPVRCRGQRLQQSPRCRPRQVTEPLTDQLHRVGHSHPRTGASGGLAEQSPRRTRCGTQFPYAEGGDARAVRSVASGGPDQSVMW